MPSSLLLATEATGNPAVKKKIVHPAAASAVKHPVTAKAPVKPAVRARAGLKTPVKTAAVPHVIAKAGRPASFSMIKAANSAVI